MAGGGEGGGCVYDALNLLGCREGPVSLRDKAEALQRYLHHSKLHSANKEKTHNEKKRW